MALQKRAFVDMHCGCAQSGSPEAYSCRQGRWVRPPWLSRRVFLSTGAVGAPTLAFQKRAFVDRHGGCAQSGSPETYFCRQGRWVRPPWLSRSVFLSTGAVGAPTLALQKHACVDRHGGCAQSGSPEVIFVDRGGGCAHPGYPGAYLCRQGRWARQPWPFRSVLLSTGTVGAPSLVLQKRIVVDRGGGCAHPGYPGAYFYRQGRWVRQPWPFRSVLLSTGTVGAPSLVLQERVFVDRGGGCAHPGPSEACSCRQAIRDLCWLHFLAKAKANADRRRAKAKAEAKA